MTHWQWDYVMYQTWILENIVSQTIYSLDISLSLRTVLWVTISKTDTQKYCRNDTWRRYWDLGIKKRIRNVSVSIQESMLVRLKFNFGMSLCPSSYCEALRSVSFKLCAGHEISSEIRNLWCAMAMFHAMEHHGIHGKHFFIAEIDSLLFQS